MLDINIFNAFESLISFTIFFTSNVGSTLVYKLPGAITIASGDVDLYDVVFSNNSAEFGGAIVTHGGFINLFRAVFINNSATVAGGAIYNFNVMTV